jgi:periplasmic divalent cation tolerance protein
MAHRPKYSLALVTAPDLKTARKLARSALIARLAACVNLVPRIESHYWWQGKVESGPEVLLLFKTTSALLARLERHVLERHPYDTPEFMVLSFSSGNERYLRWLAESLRAKAGKVPI